MNDLRFGPFTLSPLERQLRRGAEVIPLPSRAFDLLLLMAQNPGRPMPKKELLRTVWADAHVEESNLSQSISVLRRALGAEGEGMVVTLPGIGYQFAGRVVEMPAAPSGSAAPGVFPVSIQTSESRLLLEEVTEERVRWWASPIALSFAALGVLLLGLAGWLGWERYEDRTGGPPVQVVVAGFTGTGDATLDRALNTALRADLTQSPYVTLVPSAVIRQTLTLMTLKPDAELTPAVARDVCERTGSQAVLRGTVAQTGSTPGTHYLLTGEAVGCVDGAELATFTEQARSRDELPAALDRLGKRLRKAVGESRGTIARFSQPLFSNAQTGSMEAIEHWSQASVLSQTGHYKEAIELLKHATALDPNFAAAWMDMALYASADNDYKTAREYVSRAYAERDHATTPNRYLIEARYASQVSGDANASMRLYQAMLALYPRSAVALSGLADTQRQLGRHAEAAATLSRALAQQPHFTALFYGLCAEQMRSGQLDDALKTCRDGIAHGLDGDAIRVTMMKIAGLQHDDALYAEQVAWGEQHHSTMVVVQQTQQDFVEGREHDALLHLELACSMMQQKPTDALCGTYHAGVTSSLAQVGEIAEARTLLARFTPDSEDINAILALVFVGDLRQAQVALAAQSAAQPHPGPWNDNYGAIARAAILLAQHRPAEVVAVLEPARQYEGTNLASSYLRALAYQQTGQPALAEAEFLRILSRPWIDPTDVELPLARVGLAETLALEGKKADAEKAYQAFFADWVHADPDLALLARARLGQRALTVPAP